MSSAFEPPFAKRLREISEGTRPMPQTDSRKQHYVPSFLLAQWATPPKRKGTLYELLIATGKVKATKPGNVSWQRDLYTVDKAANSSVLIVEAFLGIIEDAAADPIKNLATLPTTISDEDRATIAFFLALQQFRTPVGMAQNRTVSELAAQASIAAFLGNREAVTERYRTLINPDGTDEEIRAFARDLIADFKQGKLKIKLPPEAPQQAMLKLVSLMANDVVTMSWTLIEAVDGEFIASDRGLAMWDPNLPPQRGNAWASSPQAETAIPVGPKVCLKITPGAEGFAVERADKQTVDAINLRTYGWAEQAVFGRTQDVVEEVHRAAEADPSQVPRPKVPPVPARPGT
jgi:hypothetical protein